MSFARGLGSSLQGFVSGFSAIANQFNCTAIFPATISSLKVDPDTGSLVPDVIGSTNSIKLYLRKNNNPNIEPNPGTQRERTQVKGHLVEPRLIDSFPSSENGISAKWLIDGAEKDCLLFDLQIMPTAEAEAIGAQSAVGLPIYGTVQFLRGSSESQPQELLTINGENITTNGENITVSSSFSEELITVNGNLVTVNGDLLSS